LFSCSQVSHGAHIVISSLNVSFTFVKEFYSEYFTCKAICAEQFTKFLSGNDYLGPFIIEKFCYILIPPLNCVVKRRLTSSVNLVQVNLFLHKESYRRHKSIDASDMQSSSRAVIDAVEICTLVFKLLEHFNVSG
jgi:hypothetical protein